MDRISRRSLGVEQVRFGDLGIASLLFADDVVLLESSDHDLRHSLPTEVRWSGMRVSTSKSEAMVLWWKPVDCTLQVGTECLPQAKEFKYLGVLFMSEGKMEREIDRLISATAAVKQALYRKAMLSIYWSLYVPTLTWPKEQGLEYKRPKWVSSVGWLSFRDRVRISDIRRELGVEPLLLRVERIELSWFGHLIRMPPGEVFQACPTGRRPRGRPRTRWRETCKSCVLRHIIWWKIKKNCILLENPLLVSVHAGNQFKRIQKRTYSFEAVKWWKHQVFMKISWNL